MSIGDIIGLTVLVLLLYLWRKNRSVFWSVLHLLSFAVVGCFVGLVLGLAVDNFATSSQGISSVDFNTNTIVEAPTPAWAALWISLPASISQLFFPVAGSMIGVLFALLFPDRFKTVSAKSGPTDLSR